MKRVLLLLAVLLFSAGAMMAQQDKAAGKAAKKAEKEAKKATGQPSSWLSILLLPARTESEESRSRAVLRI